MKIQYHMKLTQGSEEWHKIRNGILTASTMKCVLTPTLKKADNKESRAHVYEIAAQRITKITEDSYQDWNMERGHIEEDLARKLYKKHYHDVQECGFVTNDELGFTIGYSPDGLVGEDGLIEIKSRSQKHQVKTIATNEVPSEFMLQIQTGLLVTNRKWCDFVSYSNGMEMFVKRVFPDIDMINAIKGASEIFECRVLDTMTHFMNNAKGMMVADRIDYQSEEGISASMEVGI